MTTYAERRRVHFGPRDLSTVMRAWGAENGLQGAQGGWIYNERGQACTQGWWNVWAMNREMVLDWLTRKHTAVATFEELLQAGGRYRPTIQLRNAETRALAAAYDQVQAQRGDPRRAYTYYGYDRRNIA